MSEAAACPPAQALATQQNTRLFVPTPRRTSGLYSPAPWRDLR